MIATLLFVIAATPLLLLLWTAQSLYVNKKKAQATGLPLLIKYVTPTNPLYMMFGSTFVSICRTLGIGSERFYRTYRNGSEANDRDSLHEELGPAYMLVSPGGIWLTVDEPSVVADILHRRTDFRRNMAQFEVMNVYGKNLSTTDDEEWQKHRKVTAITFTENNSELVWRHSLSQARGMLQYWIQHQPVNTFPKDAKVFTLNVLAAAIFNKEYPFQGAKELIGQADAQNDFSTYRDALEMILGHVIPIFLLGEEGLKARWVPKSWKSAGKAVATFRSYISGLIDEERGHMRSGNQQNQHLVAALVRACESEKWQSKDGPTGNRKMVLTEQEIISNLFVYAFAGNDTTCIVLTHTLVNLAASPETQEWIAEELNHYLPLDDPGDWKYKTFPKLKRCLAVVMEALRLNHPLSQFVKYTGNCYQTLQIGSRTVTLPPGTGIHLNVSGMHVRPDYWGPEPMAWNPKRFISIPAGAQPTLENEVLASDTQEHFLPWATGQRVCPGKRFSQVELVACLAVLFRDHTLQPQPQKGESMDAARKRIFDAGNDIELERRILHEIKHPETIFLTWSERRS